MDGTSGGTLNRATRHGVALATTVVVLASYAPVLFGLVSDWMRDPNYYHGFLIPRISGYLVWSKRDDLRETRRAPSRWGLGGLLFAAALLVVGTAGAEVFTQRVSFVLTLSSLALFLGGWPHLRILGFPLAFLLLAIPLPYVVYYGLTAPMQALAAKCAVWGLSGLGVYVLAEGNVIHLPNTSLEVAEACSGIRSLYAFLALGALVAYFTAIPFWARMLVFLATIPLSVAGNAVRVLGSGLGAYLIGPEAADGTLHELFGLLVFVISLGLFILIKRAARTLWSSAT